MSTDILGTLAPAALYFSSEGHYIFRTQNSEGVITTKCVSARDVAQAFTGQDQDTGWLPTGILRTGYGKCGPWFVSDQLQRTITINLVQTNGNRYFRIPTPGLLLVGLGREYRVFASYFLDGPIYHAPFPNVHDHGLICWGQNTPPEAEPQNAPAVWRMFFDAPFNGDLANGKCRRFPLDVRKLLRKLDGHNEFPEEELVTIERSARDYIDRLIGGRQSDCRSQVL